MYKRNSKILAACIAASLAVGIMLPTATVFAEAPNPPAVSRLYGVDRYETAIAISKTGWTSADTVVVARGDDFADALSAAPLAKMYNAPIILTQKDQLSDKISNELKRLGVKKIIVVGGTGAVSASVEQKLNKVAPVQRVFGQDRYETSEKVAEKLGANSTVALATGEDYADALSIASIAAEQGMPVLLTEKNKLPDSVKNYIANNKITKTYIVGGQGVISDAVKSSVPGAERLSGQDRYATNAAVLSKFSSQVNYDNVYVSVGNNFADALAGSALAAKNDAAIVLTDKSLPQGTVDAVQSQITPKSNITLLGGEAVVPSSSINSLSLIKTDLNVDGKSYGAADVKANNANITAKNVSLSNATIQGNVYVYGDRDTLTNVTVKGIVFVDPGQTGSVTLDGVTADSIRVKSGASSSVYFKDVKANNLVVESKNTGDSVRIVSEGTTAISSTSVKSNAIIDAQAGSFGAVDVLSAGSGSKAVEFRGTFDKTIMVEGSAAIKAAQGASFAGLQIAATNSSNAVALDGKFGLVSVLTNMNLTLASGAQVDTLEAIKGAAPTVVLSDGSKVSVLAGDVQKSGNGTVETTKPAPDKPSTGTTTPGGSTGGSTGGGVPSGPSAFQNFVNLIMSRVDTNNSYLSLGALTANTATLKVTAGKEDAQLGNIENHITADRVAQLVTTAKAFHITVNGTQETLMDYFNAKAQASALSSDTKAALNNIASSSITVYRGTDADIVNLFSKLSGNFQTDYAKFIAITNGDITNLDTITLPLLGNVTSIKANGTTIYGGTDKTIGLSEVIGALGLSANANSASDISGIKLGDLKGKQVQMEIGGQTYTISIQ